MPLKTYSHKLFPAISFVFYSFLTFFVAMTFPLRAILDTNTYEALYRKDLWRVTSLIESHKLIVYGCKVIRNELRDIPKSLKVDGRNYRNLLLSVYDSVAKRTLPVENLSETLAEEYWLAYEGGVSKRKMISDFLIVAIATLHNVDVVVSEDERTLKSGPARRAYEQVNQKKKLKTPGLITLENLLKLSV